MVKPIMRHPVMNQDQLPTTRMIRITSKLALVLFLNFLSVVYTKALATAILMLTMSSFLIEPRIAILKMKKKIRNRYVKHPFICSRFSNLVFIKDCRACS